MNLSIPGLSDALGKLDTTAEQMLLLVEGMQGIQSELQTTNQLLREQNDLLRSNT